jgi:O-antigen ligase
MAATFATYRKSAMVAPLAIGLTVAYFRRRDLLKLAPLALVAVIGVSVLSPGAIGSTVSQFTRSDALEVPTVSDRTSDYDAVRPDVWSHVAFGRGWGSYNHESYRILDSEILQRTIEMGVFGLIAFLLIGVAVVACARSAIASRDPVRSPPALIGAAAAVGFFISSTLYDILAFPHGTYIFLYLAGLVTTVVAPVLRSSPAIPRLLHGAREHRPGLRRPFVGAKAAHQTRAPVEAEAAHAGDRWSRRG